MEFSTSIPYPNMQILIGATPLQKSGTTSCCIDVTGPDLVLTQPEILDTFDARSVAANVSSLTNTRHPYFVETFRRRFSGFCSQIATRYSGCGVRFHVLAYMFFSAREDTVDGAPSVRPATAMLQRFKYAGAEEFEEEECCPICLQEFCNEKELARTPCYHVYHYQCIARWLKQSLVCPLCLFQM